jgi:phage regulator Rha-like protein
MTSLVKLQNDTPITTTEIIAEGIDMTHKSVIQLCRAYKKELEEFGTLAFEMRKSGGRPIEFFVLNESQVYFLMTLMRNNEIVVQFKKQLIKEFMKMKKALMQLQIEKNSAVYIETRNSGKAVRKEVTDTIQDFVLYATSQGSKNAIRYYGNLSSMENKALFIIEQKYPNLREMLNHHQLSTLKTADTIIMEALEYGMSTHMHYKDIYVLAKERVETLATLIKPTMVISYNEVKVLSE